MKLIELTKQLKLKPRDIQTVLTGLGMQGLEADVALTPAQEAMIRGTVEFKKANASRKLTWVKAVTEYAAQNTQTATQASVEATVQVQEHQAEVAEKQAASNGHKPIGVVEPERVLTEEELESDLTHQAQELADSEGLTAVDTVMTDVKEAVDELTTNVAIAAVGAMYQGVAYKMNAPETHQHPVVKTAKNGLKNALLGGGNSDRPLLFSLPSQAGRLSSSVPTPVLPGSNSRSMLPSEVQQKRSELTVTP